MPIDIDAAVGGLINRFKNKPRREVKSKRTDRVQYLLDHRPKTIDQFKETVETLFGRDFKTGITISDRKTIPGHRLPLNWMYHVWCLGHAHSTDGEWRELIEFERSKQLRRILVHGPRGGMKTLALAILFFMFCWYNPGYTHTHTATEKHQAQACMKYMRDWAKSSTFSEGIANCYHRYIEFVNGSMVIVLTASVDGLNSPHTLSISIDEVETFEREFLNQALQIQQEQPGFPLPSLTILASTQKKPNMGMTLLIEESISKGKYEYILWDSFDVVENCPDWRRANLKQHRVDCADWGKLNTELQALEDAARRRPLLPQEQGRLGILTQKLAILKDNCVLCEDCQGRAIGGCGHLTIDTLIDRKTTLDPETWIAENMCLAPPVAGAVYPRLSEANVTEEAVYQPGALTIGSIDYGYVSDPAAINIACVTPEHVDIFYEDSFSNTFEEDLIPILRQLTVKYHVKHWIVGNDAVKLMKKMNRAGMRALRSTRQRVVKGCDMVAYLICDASGKRRMRFHPVAAHNTFREMRAYRRKKNSPEPEGGHDDRCDSIRYLCEDVTIQGMRRGRIMKRPTPIGRSLRGE